MGFILKPEISLKSFFLVDDIHLELAGLFGEDEDDWMTGSTASKSPSQPTKKTRPSSASKDLFAGLGGSDEEEEGSGLFDEPPKKQESPPKKKVFT